MDYSNFQPKQSSSQLNNYTNNQIYARNIPEVALRPHLSSTPVSTKHMVLPVINDKSPSTIPLKSYAKPGFNPGSSGPWKQFAENVNSESELRGQLFALQKCDQSTYIPSSTSSLYNNTPVPAGKIIYDGKFRGLFDCPKFDKFMPNSHPDTVGCDIFNNPTRQQIKNISSKQC